MRKSIFIILALMFAMSIYARRQRTTHGPLHLKEPIESPVANVDTIFAPVEGLVFSGYEKAQSSSVENVFVTNNTDSRITGINLSIDYVNHKGQQLHKTTTTVKCALPPGETRILEIKSWDRQHLWYYTHTQGHRNAHGTPFDVRLHINYIITPK